MMQFQVDMTDISICTPSIAKLLRSFKVDLFCSSMKSLNFIAELEAKTCMTVGQYIPLVLIVYLFIGSTEETCIGVSLEGSTVLRSLE